MRVLWLVLLLACGKKVDVEGDLAKIVPEVEARFSAVLDKLRADVPACKETPRENAIFIQVKTVRELAGAPALGEEDPNALFTPVNFESGLPSRYTNDFNPKSSTRAYGRGLLAVKHAIVIDIEKFDRFTYSGDVFTPGVLHVRATVFDLATASPTCVERYEVTNSDKIWASHSQAEIAPSKASIESALMSDLRSQFSISGPTRPKEIEIDPNTY